MSRDNKMRQRGGGLHQKFNASMQQFLLTTMGMELHKNISIPIVFLRSANIFREKPALYDRVNGQYVGLTYGELLERVQNFAAALLQRGIGHAASVAIFMRNHSAWTIADLGGMFAGGMTVPIYETLSPQIIQIMLEESTARVILVENKEKFDKIAGIWPELPQLELVVVVDPSNVPLSDKVVTLSSFEASGAGYRTEHPDAVMQASRAINRDDVASIVYTSGTTGRPKGVMLSHRNFLSNFYGIISLLIDLSHEDRFLSFLPLCHVLERTVSHYVSLLYGATTYYAENIKTIARDILEVRPTLCVAVPRVFEKIHAGITEKIGASGPLTRMLFAWALRLGETLYDVRPQMTRSEGNTRVHHRAEDHQLPWQRDLSKRVRLMGWLAHRLVYRKIHARLGGRISFMVSGGAPLSPDVTRFFRHLGIKIYEGYGLTETSPIIAFNYHANYEPGTVGHLMPYSEVKFSAEGEIITRGPNVMLGYFKNPEATREVLDKDGWFHTGDVGCFTERNNLKITGRLKEVIVTSGGKKIPIGPIEAMINESRLVNQGVLVGDGRHFISCLIFPEIEGLRALAASSGLPQKDLVQLCNDRSIMQRYQELIDRINEPISHYERIKKFRLVPYELTIGAGELTPTLKIRRKEILHKFAAEIEAIYADFK